MGSDGQISSGDTIIETSCVKVFKLEDGSIVGFAGNTYNWGEVLKYLKSKNKNKKWPMIDGHFDALRLYTNGRIVMYDKDGRTFERTAPVCLGSGWKFALAALDAELPLNKAIEIACKRDAFSSGQITILSLED
jgi:ATP-dependent protease HslVU (ClpYQ) peptidase subunit